MEWGPLNMTIALAASFLLLYQRKKKWLTSKLRWIITISLAVAGVTGLLLTLNGPKGTLTPGFQLLLVPLLYNCFDRIFKQWSMKIQRRDFFLYLRFSGEVDDPFMHRSDMAFSIGLLFIIMTLLIAAIAVFRIY